MSSRENLLYGIICILVIFLAGMSGFYVASAQLNSQPQSSDQLRTIDVLGFGIAKGDPNMAMLTFGVETQSPTATEATQMNAEMMNHIIDVLETLGISRDNIKTSYYNLYPVYSNQVKYEGFSEVIGYRVNNVITVTLTDLTKVGQVIDAAVDAGANRVQGVSFTLSEEETQSLKAIARQKAVEDAKSKAEAIAASLGLKIVGVSHVIEGTTYYQPYRYDAASMEEIQTPIIPGEMQVTVTVQVIFILQ